jgi:hypothetical protein
MYQHSKISFSNLNNFHIEQIVCGTGGATLDTLNSYISNKPITIPRNNKQSELIFTDRSAGVVQTTDLTTNITTITPLSDDEKYIFTIIDNISNYGYVELTLTSDKLLHDFIQLDNMKYDTSIVISSYNTRDIFSMHDVAPHEQVVPREGEILPQPPVHAPVQVVQSDILPQSPVHAPVQVVQSDLLPQPLINGGGPSITLITGGYYYTKYIKYKLKYNNLKNMNNGFSTRV